MSHSLALPSSYRDPAGFMMLDGATFKRVVTEQGAADYETFMRSGLHQDLVHDGLMLDHHEEPVPATESNWAKLLVPEQLGFVSYPYEWSFDEYKDAALLTLEIQERALAHGLSLKDASPYNVQFRGARPVFIDTLSFERSEGGPWVAYEQYCEQFLGPLALMGYVDPEASRYLKTDLDGFSLGRVSRALPLSSYWNAGALMHIHLHSRAARKRGGPEPSHANSSLDRSRLLVASLRKTVERIPTPSYASSWTDYYEDARYYSPEAQRSKRDFVPFLARRVRPELVFDLGTNTGLFASELAAAGANCVAFDSDAGCINRLYLKERAAPASRVLPLVMDLANPSPALGFELRATLSLFERPQADLVLCLALLHHLRITANLPLCRIADFLARLGRWLLIEFVPPDDPGAQTLMRRRQHFEDYDLASFLQVFDERYYFREIQTLAGAARALYLLERRA